MKVVIVGGVAGGASAAARIRRLDEHAQIIMIERSGYVSYANCGLPYYVGGVIKEQEELTLQTPESFWDRFRIDVRVRQEVTAINPIEKTVTVHALDSGKVYTETYDKLLLAPGAKPTVPALSGVSSERVFTLRTVEDTLRIRHFVEDQKPKSAVLAGGGFIGLEMAENLTEMGVSVTIVQRPNQLLAPLDADMASFVHAEMRRHGVTLRLGETVTGFRQDGDSVLTLLEESEPLRSDMVLLAIGVTPDTHLAKEAGLELGIRGSIAVNERMETSVPDIYAVGDAVEVTHFVTGQKALISLAGPANKQGRIAADNICGGNSHFTGSQGSSVLKLFGLTAASTGINEKAAQAAGIAYDKVVLFPASHAAYYPGAQSMAMKVLYEKESLRLLGAQIVGGEGVDKRIDVLATAIRAKMKALELTELDLSYAPPYSSAKDPVNMAGFMIEDLESGKVQQFHWNDVEDLPCDGSATLLDVRTEGEYRRGHLNGFRNIPLDDLREHLDELERDKPIYVNCQTGLRSYLACRLLTQYGFSCSHLSGGYSFYQVVTQEQQTARAAGIAYDKVVLFPASHAAYYPGAQSMVMKVLYEKESLRLLGAQIVGGDGVDKRIDVLATAIRAKMTALELTELDLSYAPPYSSAKDPVNMAGFMIEDLESGKARQFHWNDVEDLPCDGSATLLDVRTAWEYQRGHLDGFRNIPLDDLREHLDELDRGKPVYVNCQTGLRSYLACRLLTQYGFTCSHLSGGYSFYQVVTQERQTARSAYPCGMEKL